MNKYNIEISEDERLDLKDISKYIKNNLQQSDVAKKLINRIRRAIYNHPNNPKLYSIIDDDYIRKLELRKIIVGNYIIFFKVIDSIYKIQIIRIMYGRRNWKNLLK